MSQEIATFGAGCFWHVEEVFRTTPGVLKTTVGYMGGKTKNPTYEEVCMHTTEHVEVCQVVYDTNKISYEKLLEIFWGMHNPTQYHRQGPDVGIQYRSVIYFYNDEQKKVAERSKKDIQKQYKENVTTTIEPAQEFWEAESYHQKYLLKRGKNSCAI